MGVLTGVRAAIIDLDGTMLDTMPDFHVAINGMLKELGLDSIEQEQIALMVGKGSENLIRSVLALQLDAAGVEQRLQAAMDAYQRQYQGINGNHSTQ
jgi:phosphoglycolate phosphatase